MPIELPRKSKIDNSSRFDNVDNGITKQATRVVNELFDWFAKYDKGSPVEPNIRFNAVFVAVCIGDTSLWNTEENTIEELSVEWILNEYKKQLLDRVARVEDWEEDCRLTLG